MKGAALTKLAEDVLTAFRLAALNGLRLGLEDAGIFIIGLVAFLQCTNSLSLRQLKFLQTGGFHFSGFKVLLLVVSLGQDSC